MTTTTSVNLYAPEVWEDMAQAEFKGKVVVANAAETSDKLVGQPGEEVDFPKWDALSELDDLTEGTPMVPEVMQQSATKARIKEAGKAVEISDKAMLTSLGDPQGEAISQFGTLAARKVDADLTNTALATVPEGIVRPDGTVVGDSKPLAFSGPISWDAYVDATTMFGDDYELDDVYGLFIRSDARAMIYKDDKFLIAAQTAQGNDIVRRGLFGDLAGVPVYVTDRLPASTAMVLKKKSLGLMYKRRPIVEQDRDILARTNVVTTNLHYATKRLKDDGVLAWTITGGE